MWIVWVIALASANPERVLGRQGESLRERSYVTVDGHGVDGDGPVTGRWRRSSGNIEGLVFPDGVFERYTRRDERVPQQTFYYDAAGAVIGLLTYSEGQPSVFSIPSLGTPELSLTDWTEQTHSGLSMLATAPATAGETESTRWTVGPGVIELGELALDDPTTDAFQQIVALTCGCLLLDRHTAWIDGEPGVRLLLSIPSPGAGEQAEVWLIPHDEQIVSLWASWPVGDVTAQTALRAMASTATWEDR